MNNNSYPIDMAFTTRQLEQGKEKKEKYLQLKTEYDQLIAVDMLSVEQEQERIN